MGLRLGRYDVLKTLVKGELTDLLLARADGMEGFQRHVAIKRLHKAHARDKSCLEAFVNEARLSATLHHHNIVQVLDIGEQDGQPYFAMEYVHGVDVRGLLSKLSKRSEQAPLQHVVSIIAAAAAALHHAHEQRGSDGKPLGIVHRDVTPGNILVGYDGNVKIVDFGIAKAAIKRIASDQGVLKGRVPYMAPEQCAGKTIDRRSDVFALGVVAYELATVRRLFKGASEFLTMSAIVNGEIPKPSQYRRDVPPELEAIMLKALARDPRDRFQTAGEMAIALDKVAIQVGVGASTTALANYLRLQFGQVTEPWLDEDFDVEREITEVDFDGGASGLAPPPPESVKNNAIPRRIEVSRSAPIAQVRNIITPPKPAETAFEKSYSMKTDVDAKPYADASAGRFPLPPPPLEVVEEQSLVARPRKARGVWLAVGAAATLVAVAAAVVLWPTAELPSAAVVQDPPQVVEPDPPPRLPVVEEQAPPQESAMTATMSDYQAVDAGVAVEEPVVDDPKPQPAPVAAKAPAPKRTTKITPKPLKRAKPVAKKASPAKKPTWNPDELFLGD